MKCICCEKNIIKPGYPDSDMSEEDYIWSIRRYGKDNERIEKAENRSWRDGLVANVSAGYGSKYDGSMYVIAICDNCIEKKHNSGVIAFIGDYLEDFDDFSNYGSFISNMINESKKIWRRDQNLDKLLLDSNKDNTI